MQIRRITRITALSAAFCVLSGCANNGGLGSILGGMLGGGSGQQLFGTVRGVDTRNSQISVQQSDGSSISVLYDQNTKVVYQNRMYPVTNLQNGDQISARVQSTQNNAYYTDSIAVTQPVNGSTGTGSTNGVVQQLQGTVRSVDRNNGRFTIDAGSNGQMTVSMPYNANSNDANRFNSLRNGDYIRFSGVYLNNSLVELRQFY
jgi:hypothetical protein